MVTVCSHLVSPRMKIMLKANHDSGSMMFPPLHLLRVYRKGCLCSNVLKGGEDEVWFRGSWFVGFPQNILYHNPPPTHLSSPAFQPVRLLSSSPHAVSSYQWQPDGEHTGNTSRLVDQATLTERAVIVERFCGFRLASCFFKKNLSLLYICQETSH